MKLSQTFGLVAVLLIGRPNAPVHDHLCWARGKGDDTWVIRKGPWKLIQTKGWTHSNYELNEQGLASPAPEYQYPAGLQLFNLETDIGETTDVADQNPQVVDQLKRLYKNWQAEMSLTNGGSKPRKKKTKLQPAIEPLLVPSRGGGEILYDNVRIWQAKSARK